LGLIQRYFFQQICNRPEGDSLALGGILCCWPDVRVTDKQKILLYNPVWPGAITYSEALWCGRPGYDPRFQSVLPGKNTAAWQYFHEFEHRLVQQRDRFFKGEPFPFAAFSGIEWRMTGPDSSARSIPDSSGRSIPVTGGVVNCDSLVTQYSLPDKVPETIYLSTFIYCRKPTSIHAWIGFETPARSNRQSAGIPPSGQWDANGGSIRVNGQLLPGPRWRQPGGQRYLTPTWGKPANEIPYTDEEFYWTRPPATIGLREGWNKIQISIPRTYKAQNWMSVFVPVKLDNTGRWVEDLSVHLVRDPAFH
jgi:hypothetical protein